MQTSYFVDPDALQQLTKPTFLHQLEPYKDNLTFIAAMCIVLLGIWVISWLVAADTAATREHELKVRDAGRHPMKTYTVGVTRMSSPFVVKAANAYSEDGFMWFVDEDENDVASLRNDDIVEIVVS